MAERSRFLPDSWLRDSSLHGILLSNAITLTAAVTQHWSATPLLWIYWAQSVLIGVLNVIRMLRLKEFSTDGFTSGGRQPPPTRATKIQTATFFAMHYGFFHLVYGVFLMGGMPGGRVTTRDLPGIAVAVVAFALAHSYSMLCNHDEDFRQRRPNIGTLMFYPYLRILPMHLTIIFGSMLPMGALPLFVLLKSAADGGMHLVEHALFRSAEGIVTTEPAPAEEERQVRTGTS
jgi:hypothetical protein